MLSEDTLRKAVELADGWVHEPAEPGIVGDVDMFWLQVKTVDGQPFNTLGTQYDKPFVAALDALAAQLVRQVDAHETASFYTSDDGACFVGYECDCGHGADCTLFDDDDRTENIINAIVESGVLTARQSR